MPSEGEVLAIKIFDKEIAEQMLTKARSEVRFDKFTPSEDKHVSILGGQPASGKSSILDKIQDKFDGNIVSLNGDDFKQFYPNYEKLAKENPFETSKLVQPYSNYVVNHLKQEAIEKGYNVLVEGTMRTAEVPLKTANEFIANEYKAEAHVISSNYYSSRIGIVERYENEVAKGGFGRMVDVNNHDEAYSNIPNTIKALVDSGKFDNISIATRGGEVIAETARGDDVVKSYVNHRENLTPEIYLDVAERINNVSKMMTDRGASQSELDSLVGIKASLDNAFDKVFEATRDAAQKLENTSVIEKEVVSATLSFDSKSTINDVLNKCEKYAPSLVEEIRNSSSINYNDVAISLKDLDAKTVADHISNNSNGKISVEFEQQEKSKGFER